MEWNLFLIRQGFPGFETGWKDLHLFKSKEYFGAGANTGKHILFQRNGEMNSKAKANYIPCKDLGELWKCWNWG